MHSLLERAPDLTSIHTGGDTIALWRPLILCMPRLVKLSLISFLTGTTNPAVASWTLLTTFKLAKTSNKPISPTIRLVVNPNL